MDNVGKRSTRSSCPQRCGPEGGPTHAGSALVVRGAHFESPGRRGDPVALTQAELAEADNGRTNTRACPGGSLDWTWCEDDLQLGVSIRISAPSAYCKSWLAASAQDEIRMGWLAGWMQEWTWHGRGEEKDEGGTA